VGEHTLHSKMCFAGVSSSENSYYANMVWHILHDVRIACNWGAGKTLKIL